MYLMNEKSESNKHPQLVAMKTFEKKYINIYTMYTHVYIMYILMASCSQKIKYPQKNT